MSRCTFSGALGKELIAGGGVQCLLSRECAQLCTSQRVLRRRIRGGAYET